MLAFMESRLAVGKNFKKNNVEKKEFLSALTSVRGNQRVDSKEPEATYDALKKYGMKPC